MLAIEGYYRRILFSKAFEVLNEREKEIIKLRKLSENPLKLEDLSKKYKISRERVRQIKEKAIRRLRHRSRSQKLRTYLG